MFKFFFFNILNLFWKFQVRNLC